MKRAVSIFSVLVMTLAGVTALTMPVQAATQTITFDCTDSTFYQTFTGGAGGPTGFYQAWSGTKTTSLTDAASQDITLTWQNCEQGYLFAPGVSYNEGGGFGGLAFMPDPKTITFTLATGESAEIYGKRAWSADGTTYVDLTFYISNDYSGGGGGGGGDLNSITSGCTFNGVKDATVTVVSGVDLYEIRELGAGIIGDTGTYDTWVDLYRSSTFLSGNFGSVEGDTTRTVSIAALTGSLGSLPITLKLYPVVDVEGSPMKSGDVVYCSITFQNQIPTGKNFGKAGAPKDVIPKDRERDNFSTPPGKNR